MLRATPFWSYDPQESHFRSHWQVRAAGASYERSPAYSGASSEHLVTWSVPAGLLAPRTTYHWRVAYESSSGRETTCSEETSFATGDFPLKTARFDLSRHFNRDVVADPGDPENDPVDTLAWALTVEGYDGKRADNREASGLPLDRRIGLHELAGYGGPNALQLSSDDRELRIEVPSGRYTLLRFLVTSGTSASRMPIELEYADGARDSASIPASDWFRPARLARIDGCQPVWTGMDRIALNDMSIEERNAASLFEVLLESRRDRQLAAIVLKPASATFAEGQRTRFNLFSIVGVVLDE